MHCLCCGYPLLSIWSMPAYAPPTSGSIEILGLQFVSERRKAMLAYRPSSHHFTSVIRLRNTSDCVQGKPLSIRQAHCPGGPVPLEVLDRPMLAIVATATEHPPVVVNDEPVGLKGRERTVHNLGGYGFCMFCRCVRGYRVMGRVLYIERILFFISRYKIYKTYGMVL